MKNLKEKLRIIYVPFLLLAVVFTPVYSLLRWLLDIRLQVNIGDSELWEIFIPMALALLCAYIFLRPRLRILYLVKGNMGHILVAAGTLAIPSMIAQHYVAMAAYPLVQLPNAASIKENSYERFYSIDNYSIDTLVQNYYYESRVKGDHNEDLELVRFVVMPFAGTAEDTNGTNAWYAVKFSKTVSNRMSDERKEKAYEDFGVEVNNKVSNHPFQKAEWFENVPKGSDRAGFTAAVRLRDSTSTAAPLILRPQYTAFADRTGQSLPWVFLSFLIGAIVFFLLVFFPKVDMEELEAYRNGKPPLEDDLGDMMRFLVPRGNHFSTAVLLLANIILFVVMVVRGVPIMSPTGSEVLPYGAVSPDLLDQGEYWRLISSLFVHFGLSHMVYNMVSLAVGGYLLERYAGRYTLLVIYLVTGAIGNICALRWGPVAVHGGASGAIFGLFGTLTALVIARAIPKNSRPVVMMLAGLFAGVSLVIGFFTPNVGNITHVSSLVAGMLCGFGLAAMKKVKQVEVD